MARLSKARVQGTCVIVVGVLLGLSPFNGATSVGSAQQPARGADIERGATTGAQSQGQPDIPRLRIGTTAVEIDAVVTTRDGGQVTDLRPEDIELFQDGRRQQIRSLRYITVPRRGRTPRPTATRPRTSAARWPSSSTI